MGKPNKRMRISKRLSPTHLLLLLSRIRYKTGKQCLCSHKDSKQTSGVIAGSLFLPVGGSRPQTSFSQIAICGCAPFRRFSFLALTRFWKSRKLQTALKTKRTPFINQARRAAASSGNGAVQRVGDASQQAETVVPGDAGNYSFEHLYIQMHSACRKSLPSGRLFRIYMVK